MPRKSVAELTTLPVAPGRAVGRLMPDRGLPDGVRSIFLATVRAAPPAHFCELDRVALVEFAQAAARCQRAEAAIAQEGDVVNGKPSPWLLVLRDARHQVTALLPKLRLCPSARIQAKSARAADDGPVAVDFTRLFRED